MLNTSPHQLIEARLIESRYHDAVNSLKRLGWSAHEEKDRTVLTHEKHRRHHLIVHNKKQHGRYPIEHYYGGMLVPGLFFNPLVAHRDIVDQDDANGDNDNDDDDKPAAGASTGGTTTSPSGSASGSSTGSAPAASSGSFSGGTSAGVPA